MPEPLKEMFNKNFYDQLAFAFAEADKNFNSAEFVKDSTPA